MGPSLTPWHLTMVDDPLVLQFLLYRALNPGTLALERRFLGTLVMQESGSYALRVSRILALGYLGMRVLEHELSPRPPG